MCLTPAIVQRSDTDDGDEVDSKLSETHINMDILNQGISIEILLSSIIPAIEYFKNMCKEIEITKLPDNWKCLINRGKTPNDEIHQSFVSKKLLVQYDFLEIVHGDE
ncbi:hypothetical protein ACI65C_004697 [Semiaphis heraclei]